MGIVLKRFRYMHGNNISMSKNTSCYGCLFLCGDQAAAMIDDNLVQRPMSVVICSFQSSVNVKVNNY